MNAKDFFEEFVKEVTDKEGKYRDYSENGFTHGVVSPAMVQIIIKKAGLEYYPEYYTIDYTGWDKKDIGKKFESNDTFGFNRHYWNLKIAVEHENDRRDWNYEVFKLAPIKCPLRVVIGYSSPQKRKKEDWDNKQLNYLAEILNTMDDSFYKPQENEEFLIIIGDDSNKKANYVGYLYKNNAFVRLNCECG